MASGRRVLCVCTGAHEQPITSKQLAERWAKGGVQYLSRPHLSTGRAMQLLDNDGELSLQLYIVSTEIGQFCANDLQHDSNDKMARLGENDGFQW